MWKDTLLKSEKVKNILDQFSRECEAFSHKVRVSCVSGCGHCCTSPHVEASPLEMLPAAVEIAKKGEQHLYCKILTLKERNKSDAFTSEHPVCAFFEMHGLGKTEGVAFVRGRCGNYLLRPSVCRLFGSSVRETDKGKKELLACQFIKTKDSDLARRIEELLTSEPGCSPQIARVNAALNGIDPGFFSQKMPINLALEQALEAVALSLCYEGTDAHENTSAHDSPFAREEKWNL
jgi:uncharacterized protein